MGTGHPSSYGSRAMSKLSQDLSATRRLVRLLMGMHLEWNDEHRTLSQSCTWLASTPSVAKRISM